MIKENDFALMHWLRHIGLDRFAWSLRRLNCPVSRDALVLEVGSGGNPYPRANVLLDAYQSTRERHWVPLVSDRPTVLGFVEHLPFKDKVFDFVIASHVLEHSSDPQLFLKELQRVAKAGYIETPDAFMERINPYRDHRLEVTQRNDRLEIRKKSSWNTDQSLTDLYEYRAKKCITQNTMPKYPFDFHLRYFWTENIDFHIVNNDCNANWSPPMSTKTFDSTLRRNLIRNSLLELTRRLLSQRHRNKNIKLLPLLQCPRCDGGDLIDDVLLLKCNSCGSTYPVKNKVPIMYKTNYQEVLAR